MVLGTPFGMLLFMAKLSSLSVGVFLLLFLLIDKRDEYLVVSLSKRLLRSAFRKAAASLRLSAGTFALGLSSTPLCGWTNATNTSW